MQQKTKCTEALNGQIITLLAGSRLAEAIIDNNLRAAVPKLDEQIATLHELFPERTYVKTRQLDGKQVDTLTLRAALRIDGDLARLMQLAVVNRRTELSYKICQLCVLNNANDTIGKELRRLNGIKWTEETAGSSCTIDNIKSAILQKQSFSGMWELKSVECVATGNYRSHSEGIPYQCPYQLEHTLNSDRCREEMAEPMAPAP